MDCKNLFQSKKFKIILCIAGAIVIASIIFAGGMFVGFRKAGFSYRWGEDYYRTFGGRRGEPMMGFPQPGDFTNSHGAVGKIIKINLPNIIISGEDNIEKIILIKDDTVIKRFRENVKPTDLKENDFVTIIGKPDDKSQIEAKLIRIMPAR